MSPDRERTNVTVQEAQRTKQKMEHRQGKRYQQFFFLLKLEELLKLTEKEESKSRDSTLENCPKIWLGWHYFAYSKEKITELVLEDRKTVKKWIWHIIKKLHVHLSAKCIWGENGNWNGSLIMGKLQVPVMGRSRSSLQGKNDGRG